jgi:hypothetical protein
MIHLFFPINPLFGLDLIHQKYRGRNICLEFILQQNDQIPPIIMMCDDQQILILTK